MATINPYLNFNGNCEEAFRFYKSVFGGEYVTLMRFKEVPAEYPTPPQESEKIMHIAMPVGPHTILMGSDRPGSMGEGSFGDNLEIAIGTNSQIEADQLFNGLAAGGNVTMPIDNTFWGAYFGMVTDKFGVRWMVSYDENAIPAS